MLILLYGKDTYRILQKTREIESRSKEVNKSSLGVERIDAQDVAFGSFWDIFSQGSIFISKKLIFLENVFLNPDFKKAFSKHLRELSPSENIIVLIENQQLKSADPLVRQIQKQGKVQVFELLSGLALRNWVKKEIDSYGAQIEPTALEELLFVSSCDLWKLDNEIKKLVCYTNNITKKEVEELTSLKAETEIFATIDALGQRNKKKALFLLQNHLEKGDNPFYLLSMIIYQFRNLILVKTSVQNPGLHPFAFNKLKKLACLFKIEELKRIFETIFETDYKIKTGKLLPNQAILSLALLT